MAKNSGIQWTDHTFNPWRGCVEVSPGCDNCYARRQAARNPKVMGTWGDEQTGTRVCASELMWKTPLAWNGNSWWCSNCKSNCFELLGKCRGCGEPCRRPAKTGERPRVFCASIADVFEDWGGIVQDSQGRPGVCAPDGGIVFPSDTDYSAGVPLRLNHLRHRLFSVIERTPHLEWLLLTKRPENVLRKIPLRWWQSGFPGNVRLGTTVENQAVAGERLRHLLSIDVPNFVSAEPLLGPLWLLGVTQADGQVFNALTGEYHPREYEEYSSSPKLPRAVEWLIVGGESGAAGQVRPFDPRWAEDLLLQCQCQCRRVPFFMKQLGAVAGEARLVLKPYGWKIPAGERIPLTDAHGGNPDDWPGSIRVRQFPGVA